MPESGCENRIRIIDIPPGDAPEEIRKAWVGIELPVQKRIKLVQRGLNGGPPQDLGGYQVEVKKAIKALAEKSPEAAQWWERRLYWTPWSHLIFRKDVCEVVPEIPNKSSL